MLLALVVFAISCSKDGQTNHDLKVEIPDGFPEPVYTFQNNQPTERGFELGKMLFYDPGLSVDGTVSCGTCHQQFAGFANLDHSTSHGVNNCFGKRNAPVIFNLIWKDNLFLDGGVKNLEVAPLNALTDSCEMRNELNNILNYLKNKPEYQQKFARAFDSDEITSQKILKALAQFTGTMVSADSRYDQMKKGKLAFTTQENSGLQLFRQKCENCHKEPLFSDNSFRNNGLDLTSYDLGRATITELPADEGKFKVPTLRNVEVSRPYMHDGRFKNLEEVLDHYQNGIKTNKNLDPLLKELSLTDQDKADIIAFLKTLTDHTFLKNQKFSEN